MWNYESILVRAASRLFVFIMLGFLALMAIGSVFYAVIPIQSSSSAAVSIETITFSDLSCSGLSAPPVVHVHFADGRSIMLVRENQSGYALCLLVCDTRRGEKYLRCEKPGRSPRHRPGSAVRRVSCSGYSGLFILARRVNSCFFQSLLLIIFSAIPLSEPVLVVRRVALRCLL